MKNSIFKSKKFKYGGSAAALTVIVIALVLILNVVFTSLANTNGWYTDLTGASIYSRTPLRRRLTIFSTPKAARRNM